MGPESLSSEDVVKAYKEFSHVETAFRLLKTVDLSLDPCQRMRWRGEIRPIYRVLTDRVRAHAFVRMLAYDLEW